MMQPHELHGLLGDGSRSRNETPDIEKRDIDKRAIEERDSASQRPSTDERNAGRVPQFVELFSLCTRIPSPSPDDVGLGGHSGRVLSVESVAISRTHGPADGRTHGQRLRVLGDVREPGDELHLSLPIQELPHEWRAR